MKLLFLNMIMLFCIGHLFSQAKLNVDSVSNYKFSNPSLLNTNEVWGYVDSTGIEYALVGRGNGFSVISLSNPESPDLVYSDTSALSLWRDIKTYNGYAYVVNEDRFGLEIFDLRGLPTRVRKVGSYTGDNFSLQKAHNLWIDSSGVAYIFGTNNRLPNSSGTIFLDLFTDPENPKELGNYDSLYLHDGYVRDDTLYGGAVNDGVLIILDVKDKANPKFISSVNTPFSFTHNAWLSDDGNTVFTTDEKSGAFVAAYNVSDPQIPFETDRYRTRNTTNVIPHNTHVWRDFLVTSYYTAGVSIVDASNPNNLIEIGYFDTSPDFSGDGFNGCWGAYPFLPSGLLLATDMEEGLFVLRPNYQRASFLEVYLNDCDDNRITQANVILNGNDTMQTNLIGLAEFGTILNGYYSLKVEAKGFNTLVIDSVEMRPGITKRLSLLIQDTAVGLVTNVIGPAQNRLSNVRVGIENDDTSATVLTNSLGRAKFNDLEYGMYDLRLGAWGYENKCFDSLLYDCENDTNLYILNRKDEDFFELDLGWTVSGNEVKGAWTIAEPIGTVDRFFVANPGSDVDSDCGTKAFVTGNGIGPADAFDVDSTTILRSPQLDLRNYIEPYLVFYTWFYNNGDQPNDQMLITLIDTAGNPTIIDTIATRGQSVYWQLQDVKVSDHMDPNKLAYIQFEVTDRGAKHILEAGIDHFFISEGEYIGLNENVVEERFTIYPNPFKNEISISSSEKLSSYLIYDASLRLISSGAIQQNGGVIRLDEGLEKGMYFIQLTTIEGELLTRKLVKN